jgi:hypothetical protein
MANLWLLGDNIRTMTTSSPMTSTSGRRKCFNATIPARHAQSRTLPASASGCIVSLICHTFKQWKSQARCKSEKRKKHTLWPACTHSDSLSTVSLLLMTLSSILFITTSSSEGLRQSERGEKWDEISGNRVQRVTYLPARFVFGAGHRGDLRMDGDETFERTFWRWFDHFGVDLGYDSVGKKK